MQLQTEYDLIAEDNDKMLKISVKGSKDGGWGLTQKYKKGRNYHDAINEWLKNHHEKTIFCLVQFENVDDRQMPRLYLATPQEIAVQMRAQRKGNGDTILYENHSWGPQATAAGTVDKIPSEWEFTKERAEYFFETFGV